eukprot:EG_transcript_27643
MPHRVKRLVASRGWPLPHWDLPAEFVLCRDKGDRTLQSSQPWGGTYSSPSSSPSSSSSSSSSSSNSSSSISSYSSSSSQSTTSSSSSPPSTLKSVSLSLWIAHTTFPLQLKFGSHM